MPELPEVESVRRGLAGLVVGARVDDVRVLHPRLLRHQPEGPDAFAALLRGGGARRAATARQVPVAAAGGPATTASSSTSACRARSGCWTGTSRSTPTPASWRALADGRDLRFVDMRMFGRLEVDELVPTVDVVGDTVPALAVHIGRDPLDPGFDEAAWVERLRVRRTGLKRALLDQTLASGIGNIYADEALWRARLHWARPTETLPRARARSCSATSATSWPRPWPRAARRSTPCTSTSTASPATTTAPWTPTARRAGRAAAAGPRSSGRRGPTGRSFRCPACQPRPRRARA